MKNTKQLLIALLTFLYFNALSMEKSDNQNKVPCLFSLAITKVLSTYDTLSEQQQDLIKGLYKTKFGIDLREVPCLFSLAITKVLSTYGTLSKQQQGSFQSLYKTKFGIDLPTGKITSLSSTFYSALYSSLFKIDKDNESQLFYKEDEHKKINISQLHVIQFLCKYEPTYKVTMKKYLETKLHAFGIGWAYKVDEKDKPLIDNLYLKIL